MNKEEITAQLIDISNAHIDYGKGESQSAIARKIEMKDIEKKLQEFMNYSRGGRC